MSDSYDDEKKIEELLKGVQIKKVPDQYQKGFEDEVMGRIQEMKARPLLGGPGIWAPALGLCLALAIFFMFGLQPNRSVEMLPEIPVKSVNDVPSLDQKILPTVAELSEEEIEDLGEELELLEALGEDMSFLEDLGFGMMDIEIMTELTAA